MREWNFAKRLYKHFMRDQIGQSMWSINGGSPLPICPQSRTESTFLDPWFVLALSGIQRRAVQIKAIETDDSEGWREQAMSKSGEAWRGTSRTKLPFAGPWFVLVHAGI